ncbi:polysaccharide deacetylase [Lineolata rhizophorae]|uniref:Polysaccharide deacetylase n=1 Tax=Lineolata rhizophorae TaxID=578093 RepID=A0A6A6PCZ5_9PEZI|nr:polysaccharide deacetylase [Lineolata rhizophorae]
MSFLGIEGLHVFVTGAAGGIGHAIVEEFLAQGCKVSGHDLRPPTAPSTDLNLHYIQGDISSEPSVASAIAAAHSRFGPIHILAANAGITDESAAYPIWELPLDLWEKTYATNVRGTFLTVKHFLARAAADKDEAGGGGEPPHLAVVLTGSECGKFGQAGHAEYASGKAGLQYGLVRSVKNEVVKLNARARVNAVAPGWVDTPLIEGRLDDPREMYTEAQATVPLAKIAKPADVARAVVFLSSHRAAGHISGECISVDGGMEGRLVWRDDELVKATSPRPPQQSVPQSIIPPAPTPSARPVPTIKVLLSVDFDAVSGWLGTGTHPDNNMADYSSGFFSARVGVPRLLRLFRKLGVSDKVTWFVPGHSMESFPDQMKDIVGSGAEIGLHGYCHEGASQLTEDQEAEVIEHCVAVARSLTGKQPLGYRAPLYQLRENTVALLESHGFLYDTSLSHHDSTPYFLPHLPPIAPPQYGPDVSAKSWMRPLPKAASPSPSALVEVPANWYMEDMTPMQFWPHTPNSHGYVDARVIERMWMDRFEFLHEELKDLRRRIEMVTYPLVLHPDTSGNAHVLPMVERFLRWVKQKGDMEVEFMTFGEAASKWKAFEK